MSKRIKAGSRVSSEAWRCDLATQSETDRWSYKVFGDQWRDARIIGTALKPNGNYWSVQWDIDGQTTLINGANLVHEEDNVQIQTYPNVDVDDSDNNDSDFCAEHDTDSDSSDCYEDSDDDPTFDVSKRKKRKANKIIQKDINIQSNQSTINDHEESAHSNGNQNSNIADNEVVILLNGNGTSIFKAAYSIIPNGGTVHGKPIQEGEGRFFINTVYASASAWDDFDPEHHLEGLAIIWKINQTRRLSSTGHSFDYAGTEGQSPTKTAIRRKRVNTKNGNASKNPH